MRLEGDQIARSAILAAIESHGRPLSRDELQDADNVRELGVGRPGAFRALRWLLREGSVRCVYGPDMTPRYERDEKDVTPGEARHHEARDGHLAAMIVTRRNVMRRRP